MRFLFITVFVFSVFCSNAQQKEIILSNLPLKGYTQEILAPVRNQAMTGNRMRVAKKRFDDGISVHAPFMASVYLGKKATLFTGSVGIDDGSANVVSHALDSFARTDGLKTFFYQDEKTGQRTLHSVGYKAGEKIAGSITLIVYGDGKELWNSGLIRRDEKARDFSINISNVDVMQIKITDGNDGIGGDIADLGLLRILTADPSVVQFVTENYHRANDNNERVHIATAVKKLPVYTAATATQDWLLQSPSIKSTVSRAGSRLVLSNGLVSRTITTTSNAATVSLKNMVTGEEYIRAVEPEAWITINGENYAVGGLSGQVNRGYLLDDWIEEMYSLPGSFQLNKIEVNEIKPSIRWTTKRWISATQWNAAGKELVLFFTHPDKKDVIVKVHYKIYDGIPLLSKSISVVNNSNKIITVNHFVGEIIAYPEKENFVSVPVPGAGWSKPNFYIESDYAFGGMSYPESDQCIYWEKDSAYTSQVNYSLQTPCIVKTKPFAGPSQDIKPGQSWKGFNTYIMPLNGTDRERNTLSQRKMYRMLAPWVTENPVFMHLTSTKPEVVKTAVDQCVATGYEMIILSFGSGLNMENVSQENLDKFKMLADYAHKNGIQIGGYSLFSSRSINPENDVINIQTGKPGGTTFGNAPCMGSKWGIDYLKKIKQFFEYTGFDLFEHDGPYPGDFCASENHPGHKDYYDSQWNQWKQSTDLYQWLLARGVYMNTPDFYMLSGSNKTGIGYREVNWSLPRAQQIILGRQNLYDGTWLRTPSMGWTFVPLTEYQGGGAAATLEPLSDHLKEYAAHMQQNYGSGVQACYRGNRLYDTEATRRLVKKEIDHYKKYRDILNADIIHLQRPTGRDWDGILHADPALKQKGFAMLYNPLEKDLKVKVKLPLYYTGIKGKASVSIKGQPATFISLNSKSEIEVLVTIPAQSNTWLVLEQGK